MSFTPAEVTQSTMGTDDAAGYLFTGSTEYDSSLGFATMDAMGTSAMDMGSSTAFFDPIYSYPGTPSDPGALYPYYPEDLISENEGQFFYPLEQEPEQRDSQGSNEEECPKKKGKKRPPRKYTAEQMARRREQNRKAQRSYRDRKDQRIKELEEQLAAASQRTEIINSAIDALRAEHAALTGGSGVPGMGGYSFPSPLPYGGIYPPVTGI